MKLASLFRKPRWQSRDAATRRLAVAHDHEPQLLAQLGRLAREDADPGVRIAAARRLADPGIVQGLAHDDTDAAVRAQARALWLDLLSGAHAASPSATERLRLLKAQDDPELAERIAVNAKESELRSIALAKLQRPALLFERALADPDAAIRLALVERFDDEATLERLAERARKQDKQVARRARERIDELRLSRGDAATLEQRGRLLCERVEQLLREPHSQAAELELAAQWAALESALPASLRTRFQAARDLLATSRAPVVRTQPAADAAPAVTDIVVEPSGAADTTVETVDAGAATPDIAAPLIAQARFAVSLDEAQAARRQQAEQQRQREHELAAALADCERALEAGASADAHTAKRRIDELRRSLGNTLPRALAARITEVEARYGELARWQHWADRQRREQLCAEIEALPEQRLHPDAVANKVREVQAEWSRLDALEQGSARLGDLARRFHTACRATLAPTQGYFRKRHELRQSHSTEIQSVLERATALESGEAGADLIAARRGIVEALRNLDRVEPRERKALAQALKDRLAALDARVSERDGDVERAKAALIARAEALADGMPKGAVAAARELQQRWREAGNGRRKRDQAQWETFRGALDRVFGKLDAERKQRDEQDVQARAQATTVCDEFDALLASNEPPERGALARLRAAWDGLDVRDETLRRRYADLQQRLRERDAVVERARRLARFHIWQQQHRLCRSAEAGGGSADDLRAQWPASSADDIAADTLHARFGAALDGAPSSPADDDALHDVLVELELVGGVASPAEDHERRRTCQLARLSARMSGAAAAAPADELATLLQRWSGLGSPADTALDARLEQALAAALEHLP